MSNIDAVTAANHHLPYGINYEDQPKHYLHISATPCAVCRGPVIAAWTGVRQTEISGETEITRIGAVCLFCGAKPETMLHDRDTRFHFRPVEWDWVLDRNIKPYENVSDSVSMELSQDADRV